MSATWSIRPVTEADEIARCATLMSESDPWRRLGRSAAECEQGLRQAYIEIYGAIRSDGALVGFLAAMEHGIGSAPLIEYICVDSAARNGGVGTGLIGHFEDALYPEARNLYLFVSDINPHAQRLYLRLGYLPAGALSNYNYEMQTEFLFRKTRGPKQSGPLPNASSAMSEAS